MSGRRKKMSGCASQSPARVAQLVEPLPSKVTDLGSNPGWGHDPAGGWGDTMFKKNSRLGMIAEVFNPCPALYLYL